MVEEVYRSVVLSIAGCYFRHNELTVGDILRGLEMIRKELTEEVIRLNPKSITELRDL